MRLAPLAALVVAFAAATTTVRAQALLIAPSAVAIDARTRTGTVTLVNTGDQSAEVSLATRFGYPVTDSTGAMVLRTFEVTDDSMPSAAAWVRCFPEKLVLAPGARRTVRVLVTPPAGLPEGEYWTRLVVTSRAAGAPSTTVVDSVAAPGVQIGVALEIRSMLGLYFRVGRVQTGVAFGTPTVTHTADSVHARLPLTRTGNAAFVGSLVATLRDSAGTVHATRTLPLGVYYSLHPNVAIARTGLAPGRYTLVIEARSERPDVPASILLRAPIVRTETAVEITADAPR